MAFALWVVGAYVVVVCFGTLALQLTLWTLAVTVRLTIFAVCAALGAAALLIVGGQKLWNGLRAGRRAAIAG